MIRSFAKALLPPLLLGLILSLLLLLPSRPELMEAAVSPNLPTSYSLDGWYGEKQQESERERISLPADTRFSKAAYIKLRHSLADPPGPWISASIVFSGSDMNASIHRPERCLPAQGHLDLMGSDTSLQLENGKTLTFRRLSSHTPTDTPGKDRQYIHYYVFVGRHSIHHSHYGRTFQDIYDRITRGQAQRWAYIQVGAYWGGDSGIPEERAEQQLRELISRLLPLQINWQSIEGN